jgi:hypothetical protein
MNWFERHLNWTAIIITFGGFLFTCVMVLFTLGFNLFVPAEDIDQDFRYYLLVVLFTCTVIPVIGMAWVIRKKNRSPWSMSFFVPSLFSFLTLFLPPDYFENGIRYSFYAIRSVIILICIWLLGLVVILFMKTKKVSIPPQSEIADHKPLAGDLPVEGRSSKKGRYKRTYVYIVLASLLSALAVSGYSCFNIYHGYKTIIHESHSSGDEDLQYSRFVFECPKNFYESSGGGKIPYRGEEVNLWRDKLKLFTVSSSSIIINVIPPPYYWDDLPSFTLSELCIHYFYLTDYGWPLYNTPTIDDLTVTQVSVDDIPAEYATFILGYPDSDYYYPWSEIKMVCFEREGCIWVIRMENDKDKTVNPDADFEHLIETFGIID